jgi:hypothetical protein
LPQDFPATRAWGESTLAKDSFDAFSPKVGCFNLEALILSVG